MGSGKVTVLVLAVCFVSCHCLPVSSLDSQTEVREKRGTLGGAALGAAAGTLVAGPVGTVVGGVIGGFLGHEVHESNRLDQGSAVNGVRSAPVGGATNGPLAPVVVATAAPAIVVPATAEVVPVAPAVAVPANVSSGEASGVNPTSSGSATSTA